MNRIVSRALLAAVLGLVVGCGGGGGFAPVKGRVLLGGKPLAGAKVAFQPVDTGKLASAPGSVGTTDDDGYYSLKVISVEGRSGAAVGTHHVVISKSAASNAMHEEKVASSGPKELVPLKYNEKSDLKFEVPAGGTSDANFDLK